MSQQESPSRIQVSTVLLTKNVMKVIPAYIESMRDVDDIVVLDGGSTDGTVDFLKGQPNCRVFPQPREFLDDQGYIIDFSGMRNFGYKLAHHPWILCVDADESASPALLREVRATIERGEPGVYYVKRLFTLGGKPIVSFDATDHIRLFHLSCVRGCVKPVHERLDIIPGSFIGKLSEVVYVPVHAAKKLRSRFDRYIAIELRAIRGIGFWRWFRWLFLRNLWSTVRRIAVVILVRIIPKRGPRFPLSLEFEQIRYVWILTWRTRPWGRAISDQPFGSAQGERSAISTITH